MPKEVSLFVGKIIKEVRKMTSEEMKKEGWTGNRSTIIIVLDDGSKIFASSDEEGNGPGCMFGTNPIGMSIYIE